MKRRPSLLLPIIIIFAIGGIACRSDSSNSNEDQVAEEIEQMVFDRDKWREKDGDAYRYRDMMLDDVVYNDTIRSLTKDALIGVLGQADYEKDDHHYYIIDQNGVGPVIFHQKTMVVKFDQDSIVWIKIHE